MKFYATTALALAATAVVACSGTPAPAAPAAPEPGPEQEAQEAAAVFDFDSDMSAAVDGTDAWQVVGPHLRWSPFDCRRPPPPQVQESASEDPGTHGRKLYTLKVAFTEPYVNLAPLAPIGQTLVKQTWEPIAEPASSVPSVHSEEGRRMTQARGFLPLIETPNGTFRAGEPGNTFVMRKYPPGTPGTDAGWLYGIRSPAGEWLQLGLIQNCMSCHTGIETVDRRFGLPY